jgi:hypothetical protein
MRFHTKALVLALAALPTFSACKVEEPVNLGEDDPESEMLDPEQAAVGEWTGYAVVHVFSSGSDLIQLTLDADNTGKIVLGAGTPPPPVTDGTKPYPPGYTYLSKERFVPFEGFEYSLLGLTFSEGRVKFSFDQLEPWQAWCPLQPPVLVAQRVPEEYQCGDNIAVINNAVCKKLLPDTSMIEVDCADRSASCGACVCTSAGCVTREGFGYFDGLMDGDRLDGTVSSVEGTFDVHLTRH